MDWLLTTFCTVAAAVNLWCLVSLTRRRNTPGTSRFQLYNLWIFSLIVWTWLIVTGPLDVDLPAWIDWSAAILCVTSLIIFLTQSLADLRSLNKEMKKLEKEVYDDAL